MATENRRRLYNFKVVLLGEGCVGKTSLVLRFAEDKFINEHVSTLQASFTNKKLTLPDGERAQLNIWDTAGQERFHALGPIYYRGSHGAILVYDISDAQSFKKVKNWVRELKYMLGGNVVITIAGNKTDLAEQRAIEESVAEQFAQSVGAHYFETSAKLNLGVGALFESLAQLMIEQQQTAAAGNERYGTPGGLNLLNGVHNNTILYDDYDDDEEDGGGQRRSQNAAQSSRFCCSSG